MSWTREEQKQHRRELVVTLRGGTYAQDRQALRTCDGYCCLGVAADVAASAPEVDGHWEQTYDGVGIIFKFLTNFPTHDPENEMFSLPEVVRQYYGFRTHSGEYEGGSLVGENDHGKTFVEIADLIEAEPEGLIE